MKMAKSENAEDHVLKLTAFDYDGPHRSPDFLGQVRLPLATLLNDTPDMKATDKNWSVWLGDFTPHIFVRMLVACFMSEVLNWSLESCSIEDYFESLVSWASLMRR